MKILTLLATLLFTASTIIAQDLAVTYEITMHSDDPEVQAQMGMMQGSTLKLKSKDQKSRTEMNMGGLITTTNIVDNEKGKGVLLMDGMLGKQAAKFDEEDKDEVDAEEADIEVELIDESKEILGYTCKKAIIYTEDDVELVYWYTKEIQLGNDALSKYMKKGLPGLALEFSVDEGNMNMTFTATELKTKVKETKDMFSLKIPEGYSEKTMEEISKMSGQ
ncbi:hypothetical protein CW751_13525 [Brumimicrobium salinarum]|uniref:DUF4412 domain-containing protein n=1 Tax=Brumimicrobium salinarum TaxID=2058658 RepID=A0A2I0R033_9FLAO|nr:hypothetical protein [Brumimicrobium salinarum]PKR79740.1 hypothetical protein CW751_13525 [Brumimicrobium salinarum]